MAERSSAADRSQPGLSRFVRVLGAVLIVVAISATFLTIGLRRTSNCIPNTQSVEATWLFAVYALFLLYGMTISISGNVKPSVLAIGADGRMSVSKYQLLLWNAAVVFCYVWMLAARIYETCRAFQPISIPQNVILLMGFSVATYAGARAITTAYSNLSRISKPEVAGDTSIRYLATRDDGTTPDLVKIQMLVWTIIAVVIFIVETGSIVHGAKVDDQNSLPDVGQALMVLMGLGQAAYLGAKLISSDVPVLTLASPQVGVADKSVVVSGSNLGGNVTTFIDTIPIAVTTVPLTASSYPVFIPAMLPSVTANYALATVPNGYTAQLSVSVDGVQSANTLPVRF
jgi:hypothetical protein